jgi:hypothetical protein
MDPVIHYCSNLNRPILVLAFAGWNDAGGSATLLRNFFPNV